MPTYLIYRKGSNSANQPCEFGWVPVAVVEARTRSAAVQSAGVTCYANQVLEARPASKCSKADRQAADEAQSARDADAAAFTD